MTKRSAASNRAVTGVGRRTVFNEIGDWDRDRLFFDFDPDIALVSTRFRLDFPQRHRPSPCDITESKRAEKERDNLRAQLIQSQKMESIGTLAGGIAHEFNNILGVIIGNNEMVMEELPEWSHARENAEEIRVAGMRAKDVVKQLLLFSRQTDQQKKPLHIGAVVRESLKLIRSSTPANVDIIQYIADDAAPVLANATQISQLLINLCSNAADALANIPPVQWRALKTSE